MRFITVTLYRLVLCALAAGACVWLTRVVGRWPALGIWSGTMVTLCVGTALMLRAQPAEKVTWVNRIAGAVLPVGYVIGRGRLVPIVVVSAIAWVLVGVAAVLLSGYASLDGAAAAPVATEDAPWKGVLLRVLLGFFWLVDAVAVIYVIGTQVKNRMGIRSTVLKPMAILVALIVISAVVAATAQSNARLLLAVIIAGGFPTAIAVLYGLFILAVLASGSKTNWH